MQERRRTHSSDLQPRGNSEGGLAKVQAQGPSLGLRPSQTQPAALKEQDLRASPSDSGVPRDVNSPVETARGRFTASPAPGWPLAFQCLSRAQAPWAARGASGPLSSCFPPGEGPEPRGNLPPGPASADLALRGHPAESRSGHSWPLPKPPGAPVGQSGWARQAPGQPDPPHPSAPSRVVSATWPSKAQRLS